MFLQSWRRWLNALTRGAKPRKHQSRTERRHRVRPAVEALEDRWAPSANPFVSGNPVTPDVANLGEGATTATEPFGILQLPQVDTASGLDLALGNHHYRAGVPADVFGSIVNNAPGGAAAALVRQHTISVGDYPASFSGFDWLLYINLTSSDLPAPFEGVGGASSSLLSQTPTSPATALTALPGNSIYATLVPTGSTKFVAGLAVNGNTVSVNQNQLTDGAAAYLGATAPNPFVGGQPLTPAVGNLGEGSASALEVFGTLHLPDQVIPGSIVIIGPPPTRPGVPSDSFPDVTNNAPAGAVVAMALEHSISVGGYPASITGYDWLLYINLTGDAITAPVLGAGGASSNLLSQTPGNQPAALATLPGNTVYATLVPTGTVDFTAGATFAGQTLSVKQHQLTDGAAAYLFPTAPNPFVAGNPATPTVPNFGEGSATAREPFGMVRLPDIVLATLPNGQVFLSRPATLTDYFPDVVQNAPTGSAAALLLVHQLDVGGYRSGPSPGFDWLVYINLSDTEALSDPRFGVGGVRQALLAQTPGTDPSTVTTLPANGVYATLVPSSSTSFLATFSQGGTTYGKTASPLAAGTPLYLDASTPFTESSTTVAFGATANASAADQTVQLDAAVLGPGGFLVDGGTVQFTVLAGQQVVGQAVTSSTVSHGRVHANYVLPGGTPGGDYTIDAEYSGVELLTASGDTSQVLTVVAPVVPAVSVTPEQLHWTYGSHERFSAKVTSSAGTPTGSVTFMEGTTTLDTEPLVGGLALFDTTALGAGDHTITAVYSGDDTFAGASASTTVSVIVAPLTVQVQDATRLYGTANPAFTVSYSGLVNGDTAASLGGTLTFSTAATAASGVGGYNVTPSGLTSSNYTISYKDGKLSITKAPQVLTWATPVDIVYGTALDATQLDATVAVIGPAAAGALTYSPLAGTVLNAGKGQTLFVTAAATQDYAAATVMVTINVSPAPLTVAVNDVTRAYGTANPAFTVSYSGFVNGQDATALGGTLAFSTVAMPGSDVGGYTVTASGLTSSNYAISYKGGTLTVTPAATTTQLTTTGSGKSTVLVATVQNQVAGSPTPTGSVNFMEGTTLLGQAPLVNGVAQIDRSGIPGGKHTVTAVYVPDPDFQASTSSALTLTLSVRPGRIAGHALKDLTGDGPSADDTGLAGAIVRLFRDTNGNGVLDKADKQVAMATTDKAGGYAFEGLAAGTYFAAEDTPKGYVQTGPAATAAYRVVSGDGTSAAVDFGNFRLLDNDTVSRVSFTINGKKTVSDLRGNTHPGDTVQVNFTVAANAGSVQLSLVSYLAATAGNTPASPGQLLVSEAATGTFGPGQHSLTVHIPSGYYQIDFVLGAALSALDPSANETYAAEGRLLSWDSGGTFMAKALLDWLFAQSHSPLSYHP